MAFREWFVNYADSFNSLNGKGWKNIELKRVHTYEVCRNALHIAEDVLGGTDIILAEAAALFHDIGRFQQYALFKTFDDRISVNHGKLGAEILDREKLLIDLSPGEREIILQSVRFHNAFSVPELKNPLAIQILKLIRDADKLDIWRVFIEYFQTRKEERASAVGVGLPDLPGYRADVLAGLSSETIVPFGKARTLNDYKLVQLSWIYDLHFKTSFRLLVERNIIDRLCETLPQSEDIQKVIRDLKDYALSKSRGH